MSNGPPAPEPFPVQSSPLMNACLAIKPVTKKGRAGAGGRDEDAGKERRKRCGGRARTVAAVAGLIEKSARRGRRRNAEDGGKKLVGKRMEGKGGGGR